MTDDIAKRLYEALKAALQAIREQQRDYEDWQLYESASPVMKEITAALAEYETTQFEEEG